MIEGVETLIDSFCEFRVHVKELAIRYNVLPALQLNVRNQAFEDRCLIYQRAVRVAESQIPVEGAHVGFLELALEFTHCQSQSRCVSYELVGEQDIVDGSVVFKVYQ